MAVQGRITRRCRVRPAVQQQGMGTVFDWARTPRPGMMEEEEERHARDQPSPASCSAAGELKLKCRG